jgi:hypothetical protein
MHANATNRLDIIYFPVSGCIHCQLFPAGQSVSVHIRSCSCTLAVFFFASSWAPKHMLPHHVVLRPADVPALTHSHAIFFILYSFTCLLPFQVVLASGTTLAVCFCGVLFLPLDLIQSIGIGCAISLVYAMAINLTLCPALLLAFPHFFNGGGDDTPECGGGCIAGLRRRLFQASAARRGSEVHPLAIPADSKTYTASRTEERELLPSSSIDLYEGEGDFDDDAKLLDLQAVEGAAHSQSPARGPSPSSPSIKSGECHLNHHHIPLVFSCMYALTLHSVFTSSPSRPTCLLVFFCLLLPPTLCSHHHHHAPTLLVFFCLLLPPTLCARPLRANAHRSRPCLRS